MGGHWQARPVSEARRQAPRTPRAARGTVSCASGRQWRGAREGGSGSCLTARSHRQEDGGRGTGGIRTSPSPCRPRPGKEAGVRISAQLIDATTGVHIRRRRCRMRGGCSNLGHARAPQSLDKGVIPVRVLGVEGASYLSDADARLQLLKCRQRPLRLFQASEVGVAHDDCVVA